VGLRRSTLSLLALLCLARGGQTRAAVTFLDAFDDEAVVNGLTRPTCMAFSPDGRIFVAEKGGRIKVVTAAGQLLSTPFATVAVNNANDRGLLGITLDPNFPGTPYIYLAYTTDIIPPNPDNSTSRIHRITRMNANGNVMLPGSEVILIDNIPSDIDTHTGGSLRFGADGKLYVSIGDGANYASVNALALRALDINQLVGKILRINPDGTAPPDNPFYTTPDAIRSKVWQYGLRNPFRTVFRPSTGSLYVEDVGWDTWEEIDVAPPGASFGWPCYEGNAPQPLYQAAFPAQCAGLSPTPPLYTYGHTAAGGAITGGAFVEGTNYPAQYAGALFIADYTQHWMKTVTLGTGDTLVSVQDFGLGDGGFNPVDLALGPDGNLYFLNIATDFNFPSGGVFRVAYVGAGNHAPKPKASATPTSGYAPLSVVFSASGTSDADNDPLSYHWMFGDGTEGNGFTASHLYTANGSYVATLQVNDTHVTREAKVTVTVGSLPPTASLLDPPAYRTYVSGETISFSGSATDPDEGVLPPSALRWTVLQHHVGHIHFYQDSSGTSGSFQALDHGVSGDLVYYELVLTATDSTGLSDTKTIFIYPNQPPVANAGPDQALPCASPGPTVSLNGAASADPDNQPITYAWTQTAGPPVSLSGAGSATASFSAPAIAGGGTLTFQLAVNDGHVTSTDSVSITLSVPGEAGNLQIASDASTLTWNAVAGAATYDVLRGSLGSAPFAYNHVCFMGAIPSATASDGSVPSTGAGFYYLARAANACGPGSSGTDSNAAQRPNPPCP